uniref:IQCH-like ATP-grasp domain-containing protein n=1 Tax=Cyprinodon variegatus TaxID=28743 RepID=A0A3Q2DVQ3_CYPVA
MEFVKRHSGMFSTLAAITGPYSIIIVTVLICGGQNGCREWWRQTPFRECRPSNSYASGAWGEVTMLSCGNQLHGSCHLDDVGSAVPQTSVHPEILQAICMCVAQACQQHFIMGYISIALVTFEDHSTMKH